MEKRLILAIALSLAVLLSWSILTPKPQTIDNTIVTQQKTLTATSVALIQSPAVLAEPQTKEYAPLPYSHNAVDLIFLEQQAAIKEVVFKKLAGYKLALKYGFLLDGEPLSFKKESSSPNEIVFVQSDHNKKIIKRFTFSDSYGFRLDIVLQNMSNLPISLNESLLLGAIEFSKTAQAQYQDAVIGQKDKILHFNVHKDRILPEVNFVGLRDRYFCAIIEPASGNWQGFVHKVNPQESIIGLNSKEVSLAPGQRIEQQFRIYLGPQDLRTINSINPAWTGIIYYGTFDFIAQILLQLLEFFYKLVHNWGWAIVILSLAVYLALYPLTLKQMRSMKEMQVLQPHIEELRGKYKDDPKKLNAETMKLYQEHKVNPFGGCLPLLLQMPIFFALYQTLMRSIALRGAKFLWIKDLSQPDRLFLLPLSLPILGSEINILPILMAIGMFVQQKTSATSAASSSPEQQKMMLIMMPLIFGIIFYRMPAGLTLYWFINSALMLFCQLRIKSIK